MKIRIWQRIICIVVALSFFVENIAYGLSPMPGSTQAGTKADMYAGAQRSFATKVGWNPSIDYNGYSSRQFTGSEWLQDPRINDCRDVIDGHNIRFVKADYDNPPKGWENNPILKETDLLKAIEIFIRTQANIPAEYLEVKEGYFPVDEASGEIPISRIEKVGDNRYVLIVHTKFVQMWNHIRKNDVWFEMDLTPGTRRTLSVAWGIFYRLMKHEVTDIEKESLLPKNLGHIRFTGAEICVTGDNTITNVIRGNYWLANDAIWVWFLESYSFCNVTRYDNEKFLERMKWMFGKDVAEKFDFDREFRNLTSIEPNLLPVSMALAAAINYNFFNRPKNVNKPQGKRIEVPEVENSEKFIKEWMEREDARAEAGITDKPMHATGQSGDGATTIAKSNVDPDIIEVSTLAREVTAAIRNASDISDDMKDMLVSHWEDFVDSNFRGKDKVDIKAIEEAFSSYMAMYEDTNGISNEFRNVLSAITALVAGIGTSVLIKKWTIELFAAIVAGILTYGFLTIFFYSSDEVKAIRTNLPSCFENAKVKLAKQKHPEVSKELIDEATAKLEKLKRRDVAMPIELIDATVSSVIREDQSMPKADAERTIGQWENFVLRNFEGKGKYETDIASIKGILANDISNVNKYESKMERVVMLNRAAILFFAVPTIPIIKVVLTSGTVSLGAVIFAIAACLASVAWLSVGIPLLGKIEFDKDIIKSSVVLSKYVEKAEDRIPVEIKARESAEKHPFVNLVSEYIVTNGLYAGPCTGMLSLDEQRNIHEIVNLLHEDHIEIFVSQGAKLTREMLDAMKDVGKREGKDCITCRQYSDMSHLVTLLKSPAVGKRIIITDITSEEDKSKLADLVRENPGLFIPTRLLNIAFPDRYSGMDDSEKTVFQSKVITIAILARLFEMDKTPMVEVILKQMLKDYFNFDDDDARKYFDELGRPGDGQGLSREELVGRILFLIGKTFKIAERIGQEIHTMKTLWLYA